MPRYLCKREGKDISNGLIVGGTNITDDLSRLWIDCIVQLDGEQKQVRQVVNYKSTPVMWLQDLNDRSEGGNDMLCTHTHPKLNIEYPEMGYFNTDTSAVYLERRIGRQWKQGLHRNTCTISIPFSSEITCCTRVDHMGFAGVRYGHNMNFNQFLNTIDVFNPRYSSFNVSMNKLNNGRALSVALSRDVVLALHPLNGEIHVLYHDMSVGAIDTDTNRLLIREEFRWLEDTLTGVITL